MVQKLNYSQISSQFLTHFIVKKLGVNCAKFLFYATEIQYAGYPVLFYFIPVFNINSSNKLETSGGVFISFIGSLWITLNEIFLKTLIIEFLPKPDTECQVWNRSMVWNLRSLHSILTFVLCSKVSIINYQLCKV